MYSAYRSSCFVVNDVTDLVCEWRDWLIWRVNGVTDFVFDNCSVFWLRYYAYNKHKQQADEPFICFFLKKLSVQASLHSILSKGKSVALRRKHVGCTCLQSRNITWWLNKIMLYMTLPPHLSTRQTRIIVINCR